MNKPQKTKLCWNCEGSVSRTLENCPYCGVYLSPEASDIKEEKGAAAMKAPYAATPSNDIPKAPYAPQEAPSQVEAIAPPQSGALQNIFLPILLLSAGTIASIFALILLLFASHGTLTLEWKGEDWYLYALLSLPLLGMGWFALVRSDD